MRARFLLACGASTMLMLAGCVSPNTPSPVVSASPVVPTAVAPSSVPPSGDPSQTESPSPQPTASQTQEPEPSVKPAAIPEIEGGLRYRDELSIEEPDWGPGAVTLAYQWLRDDTAIDGATESVYRLTAADIGGQLSLRITGTKDGHLPAVQETAKVGPILAGKLKTTAVEVSGGPRVGSLLTAAADPWGPGEVKLSWQWYRGKEKIAEATSHTYRLAATDLGQAVKVRVTGSAKNFETASKDSVSTAKVGHGVLSPTPTPAYHGEAEVGQEVTALPKEWGPGR